MKRMIFIAVLVALTVGFDSEALAQDESDQPLQGVFQTELVYPQEKGAFQFTSTSTFASGNKKFSNDLTVEYGLTHAWQIELQWESFGRKNNEGGSISRGSGDLHLGTKYSFMNMRGSNFHSAVGFELGLPAASAKKGISESKIEYEPYVIVAKDFPGLSRLQLFSQMGLSFAHSITRSISSDDTPGGKTIEWNSGMFVPYRKARLTTEINWSKGTGENNLYLTPGIIWKLPRDMEFGVGTPLGVSRDADSFKMIIQLVYEFGGAREQNKEKISSLAPK
jgi:hypothetical protein